MQNNLREVADTSYKSLLIWRKHLALRVTSNGGKSHCALLVGYRPSQAEQPPANKVRTRQRSVCLKKVLGARSNTEKQTLNHSPANTYK